MKQADFVAKVNDRSLTVKEAINHLLTRPDVKDAIDKKSGKPTKSTFNMLTTLRDNIPFDTNKKFFEVYNTREFSEALALPTNRFAAMSRFETIFRKALTDTDFKAKDLEKIAGAGNKADDFGFGGVQDRGKDPMRGTILSKDFDAIYQKALKTADIDYDTRAFALYEKYTGQRIESVVGKEGLKISDLTPGVDADTGQVYVDVAGKTTATKKRPSVRYTDEFAEFLIDVLNKAKEKAGATAKFSEINLFQTTKKKMDIFWNENIRPALEKNFEAQLPLDKASGRGKASPKVLRKILARQLVDEFKVSKDLAKSWMGHAGAGISVSGDILEDNYTGVIGDERIGALSNNLIRNDGYNSIKGGSVNNLFKSRFMTVEAFKPENNKTYLSFSKPYRFNDANVTGQKPVVMAMTASQKKLYEQLDKEQLVLSEGRTLDAQLKNIAKQDKVLAAQLKSAKKSEAVLLKEAQERLKKQKAAAEAKKLALQESVPTTAEDLSDGLKSRLAKLGITIGTAVGTTVTTIAKGSPLLTPYVAAEEYKQSIKEGRSGSEAFSRAGAEAANPLPIGIRDIEEAVDTSVKKASQEARSKDMSFLDALSQSFTGIPIGLPGGFSSGGFITKKQSRR